MTVEMNADESCHCQPGESWHKRGSVGWCWYPSTADEVTA